MTLLITHLILFGTGVIVGRRYYDQLADKVRAAFEKFKDRL